MLGRCGILSTTQEKPMKSRLAIFTVVVLAGCTTGSSNMNRVSIGMTKAEVVRVLGQPESTSGSQGSEYMIYTLRDRLDGRPFVDLMPHEVLGHYYVRLTGGRVDAYGSTGEPEMSQGESRTIGNSAASSNAAIE